MNNDNGLTGTLMAPVQVQPADGEPISFDLMVDGLSATLVFEGLSVRTGDTVEIGYRARVENGATVGLEDVRVVAIHPRPTPPEGWVPFGTHRGGVVPGETPPPALVFSYDIDAGGMPLWERPGDLRQELGDLLARWRATDADLMDYETGVRHCVTELETLLGITHPDEEATR